MIEVACPNCGATLKVPEQYAGRAGKCKGCGGAVTVPEAAPEASAPGSDEWMLEDGPVEPPPVSAPPPPAPPPVQTPYPAYPQAYQQPAPASSGMDALIPTKNPSALIAYYLGVFSLIPCLGLVLAIPAFILGIKGLKFANEHPENKGKAHALVGIIMGGLFTLIWGGLLIMFLITAIGNQ